MMQLTMPKDIKSIVIASHNEGKVREIRSLLDPYGYKIISAKKLGINEPIENGMTFSENSLIKSRNAAKKSGLVALADDSGLCVNSLNYRPGIYSARWAGKNKDFGMAMKKIQKLMEKNDLSSKYNRRAFFVCSLSVYFPDGKNKVFNGRVNGHLQFPPKGLNGFGYDPIFVAKGYRKTFGEMNFHYKERISHRNVAFKKLIKFLRD